MSFYKSGFIGGAFRDEINAQLVLRQNKVSKEQRDPNTLTWLNANTSWVKLTSAVNIKQDLATQLKVPAGDYLAKQNVLCGGVLYNIPDKTGKTAGQFGMRSGISNQGSYGFGGLDPYGLRPMPGITGMNVSTKNRFGSLRSATITIECHNLKQLEIIEVLYMRPGYSILLEWGNTIYFNNKNQYVTNIDTLDIFTQNLSKQNIFENIYKKQIEKSNGNYDAMYGLVKNYSWTTRPDGGYTCTIDLITIGDVVESLKMNVSTGPDDKTNNTPNIIGDKDKSILNHVLWRIYNEGTNFSNSSGIILSKAGHAGNGFNGKNLSSMSIEEFFDYNLKNKEVDDKTKNFLRKFWTIDFISDKNTSGKSTATPKHVYITLGSLMSVLKKTCQLYDNSKSNVEPLLDFDFDFDENFCISNSFQISTNPSVCIIPNTKIAYFDTINNIINDCGFEESENLGKHMRILLNVNHLIDILNSDNIKDEEKNLSLQKFLETLLTDINNSLGGINYLTMGYDAVTNSITIYDAQRLPNSSTKFTTINPLGTASIVKAYNMTSRIYPSLATMIAISAQNNTEALGIDGTAFGTLSSQIEDRIIPRKKGFLAVKNTVPDIDEKTQLEIGNRLGTDYKNLSNVQKTIEIKKQQYLNSFDKFNEFIKNMNTFKYNISDIEVYEDVLKDMLAYLKANTTGSGRATAIVPIELSVTLSGISGIRIGEQFSIPNELLPVSYKTSTGKNKINFIVTGISHTINGNSWDTTLIGQTKVNEGTL
jgi:hypothetical protein